MEPGMTKYLGRRILYSVKNAGLQEGVVMEVSATNSVKIDGNWYNGEDVFVKEKLPNQVKS